MADFGQDDEVIESVSFGAEDSVVAPAAPKPLPDPLFQAYVAGRLSPDEKRELEADIESGVWAVPEGGKFGEGVFERTPKPSFLQRVGDIFTGASRRVPETEQLGDWMSMPEMARFNTDAAKAQLATIATSPEESAQIIQSQFPDVQIRQDERGNFIFRSAVDGQEYAIKPGARLSDIPRVGASIAAFTPAGRAATIAAAMGRAAVTQAAIEGSQEAAGGEFDVAQVPLAAATELAGRGIGKVLQTAKGPVQRSYARFIGQEVPEIPARAAVREAEAAGVPVMTSDVRPPQTSIGKLGQISTERIPFAGTGPLRAEQAKARVAAVQNLLRDYNVTETIDVIPSVADDLLKMHGRNLEKYSNMKLDVIDKLSGPPPLTAAQLNEKMGPWESAEFLAKHLNESYDLNIAPENIVKSTNRLGGKSAYINTPFGEVRISDHTRNPAYDTSNVNLINPKVSEIISYAEDGINFVNEATKKRTSSQAYLKEKLGNKLDSAIAYAKSGRSTETRIKDKFGLTSDELQSLYGLMGQSPRKLIEKTSKTVPVDNTIKIIDEQIAELRDLGSPNALKGISILEGFKDRVQNRTLAGLEAQRRELGNELAGQEVTTIKDTLQKASGKIYSQINKDMGEFIQNVGERRDYTKWRVGNARLAESIGELDSSALKQALKLGNLEPEKVRTLLFSKKPSQVQLLYKKLSPEGRANARIALLQEAAEKADYMSPEKFKSAVSKLSTSTGIFFTGQDKKALDGLLRALKLTERAASARVMTESGAQAAPVIGAAVLADVLGSTEAGLAALGGIGGLARVYESKPVRNALIQLSSAAPGAETEIMKKLTTAVQTARQFGEQENGNQ